MGDTLSVQWSTGAWTQRGGYREISNRITTATEESGVVVATALYRLFSMKATTWEAPRHSEAATNAQRSRSKSLALYRITADLVTGRELLVSDVKTNRVQNAWNSGGEIHFGDCFGFEYCQCR